jgi:hypothetical protein
MLPDIRNRYSAWSIRMSTPAANDATLKSLAVAPGELIPGFWGTRHSFSLALPHHVEAVRIVAATTHPDAKLVVQGQANLNGKETAPIAVAVGRTVVKLDVTAADGVTKDSYEVKVHRATARPDWQLVLEHAPFKERDSQGEVVHDGKMWVLGGYTPDLVRDVWSTADGKAWTNVGQVPVAEGVNIPVCLSHGGKIWVTGQNAQMYVSADGSHWSQVTQPAWMHRHGSGHTVFQGRMWVMGGAGGGKLLNDVWSSADGETWTREIEHAPWSPRQIFSNLVVLNDRLWLIGGGYASYQPFKSCRDVWSSADGKHWELATDQAPWPGRVWTSCAAYRGRLWLVGGFRAQPTWNNFDDVWYSADGAQWHKLETDHIWEPRHEKSVLVHDDSLWMIAGNAWPLKNDVWKLHIDGLTFVTRPVYEEYVDAEYRYDARADFHASAGPLTYKLVEGPSWLAINATTGTLRGRANFKGDFPIRIEASDPAGERATQAFTLHVIGI